VPRIEVIFRLDAEMFLTAEARDLDTQRHKVRHRFDPFDSHPQISINQGARLSFPFTVGRGHPRLRSPCYLY
jgi:hypothetical protein